MVGQTEALIRLQEILKYGDSRRGKVARAILTKVPYGYDLETKLNAALSIPNLSVQDLRRVSRMTYQEVREQTPHLYPAHEFMTLFSKVMADWTQHRVEPIDRSKPFIDNPLVLLVGQLQSFTIAQTKMIKDGIKYKGEIMHERLGQKVPKGVATSMAAMSMFSRLAAYGYLSGIPAGFLWNVVRWKNPLDDEDALNFWAALYRAGVMSTVGEMTLDMMRWDRSLEERLVGPGPGLGVDIVKDIIQASKKGELKRAGRTVSRLARIGPAFPLSRMWEVLFDEETSTPPASSPTRNTRRALPRRTIDRNTIRR